MISQEISEKISDDDDIQPFQRLPINGRIVEVPDELLESSRIQSSLMMDANGLPYPRRETSCLPGTNVKYEDQNSDGSHQLGTGRFNPDAQFGTATFKIIEHEENKS
jgi:hypothetical protein